MNYVYDILINLNNYAYEFFDWNLNDEIKHVRKIPICRVSTKVMKELNDNIINLKNDSLKRIKNKTEIFNKNKVNIVEYLCLFTDCNTILATQFDSSGKSNKYSRLLIDEEIEILSLSEHFNLYDLDYNIIAVKEKEELLTRRELNKKIYVSDKLNNLIKRKKIDVLRYIYYEIYNKNELDKNIIVKNINKSIESRDINIISKLYNILNFIYSKN